MRRKIIAHCLINFALKFTMMNKKTEELKRSRWTLEYENKLSSPTVKELSEECKGVSIDVD